MAEGPRDALVCRNIAS